MTGLAALAPFALVGLLAVVSIVTTLRNALPAIRGLHGALRNCPETREYSFRVVEVISGWDDNRWDDGKVVALPVRQRPVCVGEITRVAA